MSYPVYKHDGIEQTKRHHAIPPPADAAIRTRRRVVVVSFHNADTACRSGGFSRCRVGPVGSAACTELEGLRCGSVTCPAGGTQNIQRKFDANPPSTSRVSDTSRRQRDTPVNRKGPDALRCHSSRRIEDRTLSTMSAKPSHLARKDSAEPINAKRPRTGNKGVPVLGRRGRSDCRSTRSADQCRSHALSEGFHAIHIRERARLGVDP